MTTMTIINNYYEQCWVLLIIIMSTKYGGSKRMIYN